MKNETSHIKNRAFQLGARTTAEGSFFISSPSNNLVKYAASLKEKKYRNIHCEFLAEGTRLVMDLIKYDFDSVVHVFITNEYIEDASIIGLLGDKIKLVSDSVMRKLSDTDTSQNIVAIVKKKQEITLDMLISKNKNILFLDRVSDPNNLGTIVRTAAAANYALILNNCTDIYANKVVRGSMGAVLKSDFIEGDISAISILKQHKYTFLSSCLNGKNVFTMQKIHPVCIAIGSEAHGLDKEIISLSDEIISIPMVDNSESLNVSVATGVLAYHFFGG